MTTVPKTKGKRNRFAQILADKLWRRRIVSDKRRKERERIRDREARQADGSD